IPVSGVRDAVYTGAPVRRTDGIVRGGLRRVLQLRTIEATGHWPQAGGGGHMTATFTTAATCAVPIATTDRVQLGHGSGGKMSAALLRDHFLPLLDNP